MRSLCNLFLTVSLTGFVMAGSLTSPAHAQTTQQQPAADGGEEQPIEPQIKTLPPAYESQMLRLAEVMGALHYLRALCGADEGQLWRDEMQKLLKAENPIPQRRAQLTAHFNRGFRGYAEIYRECTKPASEAANQFLKQGMRLASEIPNRYGR